MRWPGPLATVGGVSSDDVAPVPARAPGLYDTRLGRVALALLTVLAVLACVAAGVLTIRVPPHAPAPKLPLIGVALLIVLVLAPAALPGRWPAFRRRWPVPLLVLTTTVVAVEIASGNTSVPFTLLLALAVYAIASSLARQRSIRVALAAAVVIGAALLVSWARFGLSPAVHAAVESFLPLAAAWFIGDSVAARRRYVAGLAWQAEQQRAAETERARRELSEQRVRIARELHDVIAHGLAVITVQAGVGRRLMARDPAQAAGALESIESIGRTAQEELRAVLGLLRDEEVRPATLGPAPGLADLDQLVATVRAAGTPVELHVSGAGRPLSPALGLSVYRVIQEALTNVVKHAPGARASVDLSVSDRAVSIAVTDDGAAVDPGPAPDTGAGAGQVAGHGIAGMRERVSAFGGLLVAHPACPRGFQVRARIPLQDAG
jgi:signal transduction histidine kinase